MSPSSRSPHLPPSFPATIWLLFPFALLAAESSDRQRFNQLDTSGNGYLSGTEIAPEVRPYDANRDGRIVWEEFAAGRLRVQVAEDEALWQKLDWNPDGWLDGKELDGGWRRFDADGNQEVTKAEFLAGRARERGEGAVATGPAAPPALAPPAPVRKPAALPPRADPRPAAPNSPASPPAPVAARRGMIVGSISAAPGVRLGRVTVEVSGFEDGKLASTYAGGALAETVMKKVAVNAGDYAVPVPSGAYRAKAYSTYEFNGATYHFPLELTTEPQLDYRGLGLENLREGLVRSFVLKLTGPKKGETEGAQNYTETTYKHAFYGGRVDFQAGYNGEGNARPLRDAFPPQSRLLITLTPGARVDGSSGPPVAVDLPLSDDGKWTFNCRGLIPGTYTAEARLRTPDGSEQPVRLAAQSGGTFPPLRWESRVTFTFPPSSLGPMPRFGVDPVRLYLGK